MWSYISALGMALFGGLAKVLNSKSRKIKWGKAFREMGVSAFAGMCALYATQIAGLQGPWVGFICGLAGWLGSVIITGFITLAESKLGLDLDGDGKVGKTADTDDKKPDTDSK